MELLLLLLVIFLQLGEGVGGGRQGWVWVTSGGRLLAPKQPQPYGNWALGGRSGVTRAVGQMAPQGDVFSERLPKQCLYQEGKKKKEKGSSLFHLLLPPLSPPCLLVGPLNRARF